MNQNIKITSDAIIFHKNEGEIKLLLIKRKNPPDQGRFAFPGGFVENHELVIDACQRELEEETGLKVDIEDFTFVNYYDQPNRDPRGRTITFAFVAIIFEEKPVKAKDDAALASWVDVTKINHLAFDHKLILNDALKQIDGLK